MKLYLLILAGLMMGDVSAAITVDVYGTSPLHAKSILKHYGKRVGRLEAQLNQEALHLKDNEEASEKLKKIFEERENIRQKIQHEGNYLYVNFSTIMYPKNKRSYTTIEVVKSSEPDRMKFALPLSHHVSGAIEHPIKNDLIETMQEFQTLEFDLITSNQIDMRDTSCPVFHCVTGFHHPKLQPYLKRFNEGALKDRQLILDTLNHDPEPKRRSAAAFLMGHFKDPHEVIKKLEPHVFDQDDGVRNDVMRVISGTLTTAKIHDINPRPYLTLLSSPSDLDRNKALLVLVSASESKANQSIIIKEGGQQLIALLELKQPNNHDPAYDVLKNISGKNYGSHQITAWKRWLKTKTVVKE